MMVAFLRVARLVTASTFLLGMGNAFACSLPLGWSEESDFNEAKYVFIAFVTRAEVRPLSPGFVHADYELIEALKGTPKGKGTVVTSSLVLGGCGGIPIVVGDRHLFYVKEVQYDDTIPQELKRELAPSDLLISTLSSVSFRESHSDEALANARAFAKKN